MPRHKAQTSEYQADSDISPEEITPEVVEPEAVEPIVVDDTVHFVSAYPEPFQFPIMDIRAERLGDKRLMWRVPKALADNFALHHHVQMGRVFRRT